MGFYLDGKVTCVVGTHTHVQTADNRILPKGTAYISDLGMVGPYNSSLGINVNNAIDNSSHVDQCVLKWQKVQIFFLLLF